MSELRLQIAPEIIGERATGTNRALSTNRIDATDGAFQARHDSSWLRAD